jgi:subtilase family serine protease
MPLCLTLVAVTLPALSVGGSSRVLTPTYRINRALGIPPFPFGPSVIQQIYRFDQVANQGAGQVIALIDAYDDPNAESDLGVFNTLWNLPACTTANGCFTKIYATGTAPPEDSGWALEISLDTQWAHAMAPLAKILLVEAASDADTDLFHASDVAVQMGATVVSMSFTGPEFTNEVFEDLHFVTPGVTFVAASGDGGNFGGVGYPAASPFVVGVGGTTLVLNATGGYGYETAWDDSAGGVSAVEREPSYQTGVQTTGGRGVPDVAYDADPATGVAVYDSVPMGGQAGWYQVGGTSMGTPQWSALFAIANSLRVAAGKQVLSKLPFGLYRKSSDYHDILLGTNGECGAICDATSGYDFVTGMGTPKADLITQTLVGLP